MGNEPRKPDPISYFCGMQSVLEKYVYKIQHLRVAPTKFGKAPHKPVLVISLIELLEKGHLFQNRFDLTPELVAEFKENWALLVQSGNNCDFSLPFFHLQTDGFWTVWLKTGKKQVAHIKSIFVLEEEVSHGELSEDLFLLLTHKPNRDILLNTILDTFFPGRKSQFLNQKRNVQDWNHQIENDILKEAPEPYGLPNDEDVAFIRSAKFQQVVLRVYDYTCCISGMKVIPMANHSMIDACHIIPFRESGDNSITNGIALCPNLHRAFDRNLIAIDENFRVLVSNNFNEKNDHPYGLRVFNGQEIKLPHQKKYWPDPQKLAQKALQRFIG